MISWSAARAWTSTPGPTVAVEIAPGCVTAVALGAMRSRPVLIGHAREPLPDGAVAPGAASANVVEREAVTEAVRRVLNAVARRPRTRVGLVVPDAAAKVSLLGFEAPPRRAADLVSLIRWRLRKSTPFRMEDARIAWSVGAAAEDGGRQYVVAAMRRDVVAEYERPCLAAGVRPGLVNLATFGAINAALAGRPPQPSGDWMLVHAAAGHHSVGVVRGRHLVSFRSLPGDSYSDLSDLLHQTMMYYEDRLGGAGIETVCVAASEPDAIGAVTRALPDSLDAKVTPAAVGAVALDGAAKPAALATAAAPIGTLLGARRAA